MGVVAPEAPARDRRDASAGQARLAGVATSELLARSGRPPLTPGLLPFAVGAFCGVVGALTFVTPHQFSSRSYALLQPFLGTWGAWLILGGAALLGVAVFSPPRALAVLAHALAGLPIVLLGVSAALVGGWTALTVYTILGLGTALAPLLPRWIGPPADAVPGERQGDYFAVLLGLSAACNGLIMLILPGQYSSFIFDPIRPVLPLYGVGFLVGGVAVVVAQLRRDLPRPVEWGAHLLLGAALSAFGPPDSLPNRAFTSFAYYNGFGLVIALLPWLAPRLRRVDPASLRMRLALALAAAAALPLTFAVTLVTDYEQRAEADASLARQERLAIDLAQDVGDYLQARRALVVALAAVPDLLAQPPAVQQATLQAASTADRDLLAVATIDADGTIRARSDGGLLGNVAGTAWFAQARTGSGVRLDLELPTDGAAPPPGGRLGLSAPIGRSGQGQTGPAADGLVVAVLPAERLRDLLARDTSTAGITVSLVDDQGRLIAAPHDAAGFLADLRAVPPVAAFVAANGAAGSLRYRAETGEQFVGYAAVPGLGWGVVVEYPAASALASVQVGRDLAFVVFLVVIVLAAAVGAAAATWLVSPLRGLARAADHLAAGDMTVPLPRTQIVEIARLATAFGEMRDALVARTAARERPEDRLRFLSEASDALVGSLDFETTLQKLARLTVPTLADYCVIDMIEADGSIRRLVSSHSDPTKDSLVRRLRNFPPEPGTNNFVAVALRRGEPVLVRDLNDQVLVEVYARNPEHLAVLRALRVRSLLVVPLLARGRTLGSIACGRTGTSPHYTTADLPLAEELARRAALSIDNARLYQEAQAAIRARDEFLSIAAHELRTPVTSIKGFAQMLMRVHARGEIEGERLLRSLTTINEAADRLTTLTADLLDVSRIHTGRLPLRPEPLDLVAQVRALVERYRDQLGEHHTLVFRLVGTPGQVVGDADRLEQVLTNLIDNAIKYSPRGGEILVEVRAEFGGVVVRIEDQGIGLSPGAEETIFQPFSRAPNAARQNVPGLGLGLYICRSIIERHGGTIRASSPGEGLGTVFEIRLPLGGAGAEWDINRPAGAAPAPTTAGGYPPAAV